jgi:hypothetical protein
MEPEHATETSLQDVSNMVSGYLDVMSASRFACCSRDTRDSVPPTSRALSLLLSYVKQTSLAAIRLDVVDASYVLKQTHTALVLWSREGKQQPWRICDVDSAAVHVADGALKDVRLTVCSDDQFCPTGLVESIACIDRSQLGHLKCIVRSYKEHTCLFGQH